MRRHRQLKLYATRGRDSFLDRAVADAGTPAIGRENLARKTAIGFLTLGYPGRDRIFERSNLKLALNHCPGRGDFPIGGNFNMAGIVDRHRKLIGFAVLGDPQNPGSGRQALM